MKAIEQTARFLFAAVKKASVNYTAVNKGDTIIITGANSDTMGIVYTIEPTGSNKATIVLDTGTNKETLQVSSKNFIHIIQKADMLNMRNHNDYERDLKDIDKGTHKLTEKDQHPEYGPDTESDKSELPAAKISLVMKNKKVAIDFDLESYITEDYYYDPKLAVQDILRMLRGEFNLDTLRLSITEQKRSDEEGFAVMFDEDN